VRPHSRRSFFRGAGAVLLAASDNLPAAAAVPRNLDHVILGCNDLDRAVKFVEERTGVRAARGGVHPGRGTWNSILSLGGRSYLEIIAPDPKQTELTWFHTLPTLSEPRLLGWVVRSEDIEAKAKRLREAGFALVGPKQSSRERPDGRVLRWSKVDVVADRGGLLPAFIQWTPESVHPSEDSPSGVRLTRLEAEAPDVDELRKLYRIFDVDLPVKQSTTMKLRAQLQGPKGAFEAIS
jgi:catechol 2,3-dioxygenase-like lactoylglutathione lyase family enzyme